MALRPTLLVLALLGSGCGRRAAEQVPAMVGPMRYLEVGESRVRFVEANPDGAGTPWVMVHGIGGRLEHFAPLIADAAAGHRVLAFDLPGFGESTNPAKDFRIDFFVSSLRAVLDQLGVERANLVCHSMGGQICLQFALENAERTATLTLVAAAGTYDARYYSKTMVKKKIGLNIGASEGAHNPMLELITGGDQAVVKRMFVKSALPLSAFFSFRGNLRAKVKDLRVPTLIIWGTDDEIFPVEESAFLHENIAGSELHLLDGATHMLFDDHHAQLLVWIDQFVTQRERPR